MKLRMSTVALAMLVSACGLAVASELPVARDASTTTLVVVAGTGTVSGKVLMSDGTPAAGVEVRLMGAPAGGPPKDKSVEPSEGTPSEGKPEGKPGKGGEGKPGKPPEGKPGKPGEGGPGGGGREAVARGTTASDGSFNLGSVPAGEYMIVAGARGKGMGRDRVTVTEGNASTVEITLAAPGERPGRGGDKSKK